MEVYTILTSEAYDYDNNVRVEVYSTKEKALKEFNELVKIAKDDMGIKYDENGKITNEDIIEDIDENYYSIYEYGYYSKNHITIILEMKIVK